jgi:hypothetical protein
VALWVDHLNTKGITLAERYRLSNASGSKSERNDKIYCNKKGSNKQNKNKKAKEKEKENKQNKMQFFFSKNKCGEVCPCAPRCPTGEQSPPGPCYVQPKRTLNQV